MKILITGIDGFTGQHLETYLLKKGFDVFGTVSKKAKKQNHHICNICNIEEVNSVIISVKPEYIIHLAAISFVGETDKLSIYDVNVLGTQNILDSLLNLLITPKKVIIASSAVVYGNQSKTILDEGMCPKPINHYGYSKLAMENMVATYYNKLNILVTRPFNYTGIGHSENFIIPKIIKHFSDKQQNIQLGNLDVAREFNDIEIILEMYYKLLISDKISEIINLCTGVTVKLIDVISYIEELAGYKIDVEVNPKFVRKNEILVLRGSTKKLNSIINIETKLTIKDTLKNMYTGEKYD